jgi:uncharacterized protein (TIGR03086 family)
MGADEEGITTGETGRGSPRARFPEPGHRSERGGSQAASFVHLDVLGNIWAAENVKTGSAPRPSGDIIGERDPVEAYATSADAMMAAFDEPGAFDRMVTMPFGEMPAAGLAGFRFVDLVVHTWDLAKATGQETDLAPDLCEAALAMSRQRMTGMDRANMPFKDEVAVLVDAPAADRLAGFLGRQM